MTLKYKIIIVLYVIAISIQPFASGLDTRANTDPDDFTPVHIQYSFIIKNSTNRLVENAQLWTYAPVKQTAIQKCLRIKSSFPYQLIIDDQDNQILHFTFPHFAPFATKTIAIEADLLLSFKPDPITLKNLNPYVRAEKYCESNNPKIIHFAQQFQSENVIRTAMNVFQWVSRNLQYAGYLKNVRGALYALTSKTGDCTEYMYLFSALCRANDIPTRCIGGYICTENTILTVDEYHNWAEFYGDGTWQISDPQKGVFMQHASHYVAMRIIAESPDNPMGEYNQFRFSGEGLKVKMN